MPLSRRQFAKSVAVASAGLAVSTPWPARAQAGGRKIKLGMDNFAVRAMNWGAEELIDYAASLRLDTLFITDLKPFKSFEDAYLIDLRNKAADRGLEILLGSWSICPTSKSFRKDWGTAEEHLALGIRMARALGSPAFRVVLGTREDRLTDGGIQARIADTVKVLKSQRRRALDAGVKIAIENHAGDMQAWELVGLVEEAGTDFVGVNMDSGNAAWTLEDPLESLEQLGPYAVTTSLRDSAIWESEDGATVQWTAMGEGDIDWHAYFQRYAELCPQVAVNIETISGFPVNFPYLKPEFWRAFPQARAKDFARFLALARRGKPREPQRPQGREAEQAYQKAELERSLRYCRETLGLGLKA
jgi:sugar phosphate isomerase/epimerase